WESDFLNCSNGFRPGRRTMDCIALLDSYINERNKDFWVIEGDIHAAFDRIHQATLHQLLAQRIADQRLLEVIDRFRKAGMMQGELFTGRRSGHPRGPLARPGEPISLCTNWIGIGGPTTAVSTARGRSIAGKPIKATVRES